MRFWPAYPENSVCYARTLRLRAGRRTQQMGPATGPHEDRAPRALFEHTVRSVLPTALAHGVTTEAEAAAALASMGRDADQYPDRPVLWPLLIGAWKRKERA